MPMRRFAIAACAPALLTLLAVAGCSRQPGPATPEIPPQVPQTAYALLPADDQNLVCELELLARGYRPGYRVSEDTLIILLPAPAKTAAGAIPNVLGIKER